MIFHLKKKNLKILNGRTGITVFCFGPEIKLLLLIDRPLTCMQSTKTIFAGICKSGSSAILELAYSARLILGFAITKTTEYWYCAKGLAYLQWANPVHGNVRGPETPAPIPSPSAKCKM